jgi:hypothetical protein
MAAGTIHRRDGDHWVGSAASHSPQAAPAPDVDRQLEQILHDLGVELFVAELRKLAWPAMLRAVDDPARARPIMLSVLG